MSSGVLVAAVATVVWCFVLIRLDFDVGIADGNVLSALAIGPGVLIVAGVLLTVLNRSRFVGIGIVVGAPVAYILTAVVLVWLAINSQY